MGHHQRPGLLGRHGHPAVGRAFHGAVEQVDRADEIRREAAVRIFVDVGRRAGLHDPAAIHHRDPGRQRHRLLLVVGDDDEGDADLVLDVHQLELGLLAQLLVERRQRLVQQQQLRLLRQRPGQGDALALAAGQLVRLARAEALQLHQLQELGHPVAPLGRGHRFVLQPVADVLLHAHVGEQGIGLEHHVDRPLIGRRPGDVLAVDQDPPGTRRLEAGEHAQERGLAAAGAAEQAEQLLAVDLEIDAVDRGEVDEALRQPLDPEDRPGLRVEPGPVLGVRIALGGGHLGLAWVLAARTPSPCPPPARGGGTR
jgi:hypothetical protein